MSIARIFELIRQEQVVFFVGSGMSKYAGYPLGRELSTILYNSLSKEEVKDIEKNLSLSDLSEQFIRLKDGGRSQLNRILENTFLKKPTSLKYHEIIAKIPHIKTIITTNYDNLFESAYGNKAIKILEQNEVAKIDGKNEIFKIHGDLSKPETVIISKSDYARFFSRNDSSNLYWSVIAERISNKTIVFIGYEIEDDNVTNFIEKVWIDLGANRKEAFLISPDQKNHKINHLKKKGIQYINFKSEPFIDKLYQNIKDNITSDFNKGYVKAETLRNFFLHNNLLVDLKAFNDNFKIANVRGLNGGFKGNLSLTFKEDGVTQQKFKRFLNGEEFGELEFDKNNLLDFNFSASSISLLDADKDLYKIILKKEPSQSGLVDIVFEDGFELNNIEYSIFASQKNIKIILKYKNTTIELSFKNGDELLTQDSIDFKVITNGKYDNTSEAIKICTFLEKFTSGIKMTLFPQGTNKNHSFTPYLNEEYNSIIKDHLEFYEKLKNVETIFKLKFRNIAHPTTEVYNAIVEAINASQGREIDAIWTGELEFDLLEEGTSLELLLKVQETGVSIRVEHTKPEIIEIYGQAISLGFKSVIYSDLTIVNLQSIMNKKDHIAKIKSKSKSAKIIYQKNSLMDSVK